MRWGLAAFLSPSWQKFGARIACELETSFQLKKFDAIQDIRLPTDRPPDRPVLVIGGESGTGRTWSLCAVGKAGQRAGDIVALVDARQTARDSWNEAAALIWQRVLERDGSPPLSELAERIGEALPNGKPSSRIVVLVDDMHDAIEARHLIEIAAHEPGVMVGMAVPSMIARQVSDQYSERVHLVEVGNFTVEELHQLLDSLGHDWTRIPVDVRQALQLPVLAGLYGSIADDPEWHPTREYELYEEMWDRIAKVGRGPVNAERAKSAGRPRRPHSQSRRVLPLAAIEPQTGRRQRRRSVALGGFWLARLGFGRDD